MGLFYFECEFCKTIIKRIKHGRFEKKDYPQCKECGLRTKRMEKPPTSQVLETLDNGLMPKRLERFANAEELYKNRNPKK